MPPPPTATTLEKLFVQIFERKDWIIEQVQHEADTYTQQYASRFLIDGITPPPWLLNPSFTSNSANPNELEKEEIISKLLLRPPRDSVSYSRGDCSLYYRPVVAGGNGGLSNEICLETHGPNKGLNESNERMTTLEPPNNDIGSSLNCVVEQNDSINSPQNETDARISSIYAAPDMSLARIQRSKSRQKARELRNSGKTAGKSCLSNENRTHISFSGELKSKSGFHQVMKDKCPSEAGKGNDISGETSMVAEGKVDKGDNRTNSSGRLAKSSGSIEHPSFVNDQSKNGSSSEKEVLDGILVQPTGSSLQQSGQVSGVMKEGKLPEVCLGSYASQKSITEKTQDTQMQNKPFCGRVTRSRSSSQQTSVINKSLKLGTSASCISKEGGGALSQSVGDLRHGLNAYNKLLDAVETSQVLSDRIRETQAICSNEGVLKPVISSNIILPRVTRSRSGSMKESPPGADHQKIAEIVVEDGPIDVPVAMQPLNSGIKLDPVALCMESEGLTSRQSPDCCMVVKPKQLNFDEIDESDLNEICSPLSKKRKLDGLSGHECYPSKESASSIDHFEQQLPNANVLSSSPKAARTHSHNTDECTEDETGNIGLDTNENLVVEDVEHNSRVSLHADIGVTCEVNTSPTEVHNIYEERHSEKSHLNEDNASLSKMQIEEGDQSHKGEKSTADAYASVSKNTKASFVSSLTKEGNKGFEDIGSSKSKEFEVGTNPELPNTKLNSVKGNTWPLNHQRNVDDQSYCFSESRGFRVHIQRDVIPCDLETPENDLHSVKESASILSSEEMHVSQSDGIICDLPEEIESLHALQAAEATVTEVDNDTTETANTLKQSEPTSALNLMKNAADDSTYSLEPEETESLHTVQAAEATVTEVANNTTETANTLEQSEPTSVLNLIKNAADDSTYSLEADVGPANPTSVDDVVVTGDKNFETSLPEWVSSYGSSQNDDKSMIHSDEIMPVYEGFIIDEEVGNASMENAEGGIDFQNLEIPSTTIASASFIEQICKSATMQTPLSQFSSTFKHHECRDLYEFMADGMFEHMDLGSTVSLDEDSTKHLQTSESDITEIDYVFQNQQKFDSLPFVSTPFYWQSKNHYSSPVGKFWERSASSSGSSEKQLSSNPELTCFPIEEDPSSNEESEHAEDLSDEIQEKRSLEVEKDIVETETPTETHFQPPISESTEMQVENRENDDEVAVEKETPPEATEISSQHANPVTISMKYRDRCSSNSVNTEASVPKTRDKVKYKPKNHPSMKISRYADNNRTSSIATRASSRGNVSEYKNKSIMRSGTSRLSQKEVKRNNIVSNITSFVPMVQQKQAAAVCTVKRDIKVKALEAAEAAKRRDQEKENERKMKKEALKLERARIGIENAREMELNKKKKQEELKKKEADIAARKRQREEDEKKQVAKKRKLVAEAQKNQKLQHEKSRVGKIDMEKQQGKNAAIAANKKGSESVIKNRNTTENSFQKQETELRTQVASVPENREASSDCGEKEKVTKTPVKDGPVKLTSQENSYDISPYQITDDEDDEEDDQRTKKFFPSWASKSRVGMILPLQQTLDPETIFPVESFCSMDEVLLPRRLQAQ